MPNACKIGALCIPLGHYAQEDIRVAKRCRATRNHIWGRRSSRSIGIHSRTWRGIACVGPHGIDMAAICYCGNVVAKELSCQAIGAGTTGIRTHSAELQGLLKLAPPSADWVE